MSKYVPGYGPSNAQLAVIGEAPGAQEESDGRPFVGASGNEVRSMLYNAGIDPNSTYMTNVVKVRPPNNDLKLLPVIGHSIDEFIPQLWEEIHQLQPNAILAFGNVALQAITGMKGIEKYRGSILTTSFGYPKVVATVHPASMMHAESDGRMGSWKDKTFIQWDVNRAVLESKTRNLELPRRNLIVCKSSVQLLDFFRRHEYKKFVAVDIETFRTFPVCISFAFDSEEAISVPLFPGWTEMSRSDLVVCWQEVSKLLYNPLIYKIGQNFGFDEGRLKRVLNFKHNFGMPVNGFFFDTMLGFRTLYCELPARLQFISSVLTREPYYKDEGHEYNPKKDKADRLLSYNAKDAVVTFECFERELEELRDRGLESFFFEKVMPLHSFYRRVEERGILRDNFAQKLLKEKYEDQLKERQEELNDLIAQFDPTFGPLNVMSNGPRGQVAQVVFGILKCPARKGTDEITLESLMQNAVKDPEKIQTLKLILEVRKIRKTIGTYIDAEVDYRGRFVTGYRIMLETGRTSTSILKSPVTTTPMGLAFQTITKHGDTGNDLRKMFIADPGYILIEPDLSQAEARVVAVLARDKKLQRMFQYNVDIHRVTAAWISDNAPESLLTLFFSATPDDVTEIKRLSKLINEILKALIDEDNRQIGKKFRHAGHYNMKKREASRQVGCSEYKAGRILDKFHKTNPNIQGVFHHDIIEALKINDRKLKSPFGRERQFLNKWGDDLFKEAYAQLPQSIVSDQLKYAMLRIEARLDYIQILEESHDSFLAQVPKEDKYVCDALDVIKQELEVPINFKDCTLSRDEDLIIPSDFKIGPNWEEMEKVM